MVRLVKPPTEVVECFRFLTAPARGLSVPCSFQRLAAFPSLHLSVRCSAAVPIRPEMRYVVNRSALVAAG